MKNIIFDYVLNKPIAICETQDAAHAVAECLSYMKNGNAIYGLFQMGLVTYQEALAKGGAAALNDLVTGA